MPLTYANASQQRTYYVLQSLAKICIIDELRLKERKNERNLFMCDFRILNATHTLCGRFFTFQRTNNISVLQSQQIISCWSQKTSCCQEVFQKKKINKVFLPGYKIGLLLKGAMVSHDDHLSDNTYKWHLLILETQMEIIFSSKWLSKLE